MKMEWNNCFLCLINLNGIGERNMNIYPSILLRYLLETRNQVYDDIKQDVLKLMKMDCTGATLLPSSPIQFCDECHTTARQISQLHLQLEVIQMKLIDRIQSIKNNVIGNSNLYGNNDATKIRFQEFENTLNMEENAGISHDKERMILKLLYSFQRAVYEKYQQSEHIPLVYLQKFLATKPVSEGSISVSEPSTIVKREPVLQDNEDFLPDSPLSSNFDHEPMLSNESQLVVTSGQERIPSSIASVKADEEDAQTPPTFKCEPEHAADALLSVNKRSRAAAIMAAERIRGKVEQRQMRSIKKHLVKGKKVPAKAKSKSAPLSKKIKSRSTRTASNGKARKIIQAERDKRRRRYKCDLCPFKSKDVFRFEGHIRSHETADKTFTCDECDKRYSVKQNYELHLSFHARRNKIKCECCEQQFSPLEIGNHYKTHSEKVFHCESCSFSCITRERFITHLHRHSSTTAVCDFCSKPERNAKRYLKHLFDAHQAIKKVYCDIGDCKKDFLDPRSLLLHKQRKHNQSKPVFECQFCGKNVATAGSLKIHERMHTGEKPQSCVDCSERFSTKANLDRHRMTTHGAPKLKCEYCTKEFTTTTSLASHTRLHEGNGMTCEHCGKLFGDLRQLRRHLVTHTSDKNFICEECGRGFASESLMKRHMLTHSVDKNFKCTYCPKAFVLQKYLTDHLRIHTGEKPFVCDICGKAFSQRGSVAIHKRKHTETPPVDKR